MSDSAKHQRAKGVAPKDSELSEDGESCRISFTAAKAEGGISSLADLDRLDRLALVVMALLFITALGLIVFRPGEPTQTLKKGDAARQRVVIITPELDRQMAAATTLLNGGDPTKAGQLLDKLIAEFPYEGGPHMLKGDLFLRKQQPVEALHEYRQGVDLNPDFLDKKMVQVFQGKKVKNALEEARLVIDAGLARTPGDANLLEQRKVLYYMLRKVAGSCG